MASKILVSSSIEKPFMTKQYILKPYKDIKPYKEIKKLTIGQVEDYTTECLLDYEYIKNHYKLIAADLSRQK